jgi:hypothetical protein
MAVEAAPKDMTSSVVSEAFEYPLMEALYKRRTRRFARGMEMKTGLLQYKSEKSLIPLSQLEEAILCHAMGGVTGSIGGDLDTHGTPDGDGAGSHGSVVNTLVYWAGKTYPSPCSSHGVSLLFTNDEGVFVYEPEKVPGAVIEIATASDRDKILQVFWKSTKQVSDRRLTNPNDVPGMVIAGDLWNWNAAGTTLFIPVVSMVDEWINLMITEIEDDRWQIIDERADGRPCGWDSNPAAREWCTGLQIPVGVWEQLIFNITLAQNPMGVQNGLLVAEAMGLGSYPCCGIVPQVVLGELGFDVAQGPGGEPYFTGKRGVIEPMMPPYYDSFDAAVDHLVDVKFGSAGTYCGDKMEAARYSEAGRFADGGIPPSKQVAIQVTKDVLRYCWETYGRFPLKYDAVTFPLTVQYHHLDIDFYDKYYRPEHLTDLHRQHLSYWHALQDT